MPTTRRGPFADVVRQHSTAASMVAMAPRTLVTMMSRERAKSASPAPTRCGPPMPAFATTRPTSPSSAKSPRIAARAASRSVTSTVFTTTRRPAWRWRISVASSSSRFARRAVQPRSQPREASSSTRARPMPEVAPVTIADGMAGCYTARGRDAMAARASLTHKRAFGYASRIMQIALTKEQESLRRQFREYFAGLVTPAYQAELATSEGGGPLYHQVLKQMGKDGWLGIGWPKEYGGQ